MSVHLEPHHLSRAESLVADARANGGLAPVDLERFWADQEVAARDPFSPDIRQPCLGLAGMSKECLFAELGMEEDWYPLTHDDQYVCELSKH